MKELFDTFVRGGDVNLWESFKEHWQFLLCWVLGLIAVVVAVFLIVRAVNRKKRASSEIVSDEIAAPVSAIKVGRKSFIDTKALVFGALCLGLAFILSYIKLWEMPQGGSITLASSLPIILFSYIYGWKYGFAVSFAYSLMQIIQSPGYVISFGQAIVDYIIAFTILGVAGFFRKNIIVGTLVATVLRYFAAVVAGLIWYQQYNATQFSGTAYCFIYNAVYMIPELAICLIIVAIPAVRRMFAELQRKSGVPVKLRKKKEA